MKLHVDRTGDLPATGVIGMKLLLPRNWALPVTAILWLTVSPAVAQAYFPLGYHHADTDSDWQISLSELLRVIQFFNSGGYHYAYAEVTEDGYAPGPWDSEGEDWIGYCPHHADYLSDYWAISLSELLRVIQFFNGGGLHWSTGTEDGFAPGPGQDDSAAFLWHELEASPGALWVLEFEDIDGDEAVDVYVSSETSGLAWWKCDGHGGFTRHTIGGPVQYSALIDFDGDGDTDILGPRIPESYASWWTNDGSGVFVEADPLDAPVAAACPADRIHPFVCDLNKDGLGDIAAHRSWWRNEGGLEFTEFPLPPEVLEIEPMWGGWGGVEAVDFDGDSDIDVLARALIEDSHEYLFWLENLADTTFAYHVLLPLGPDSFQGIDSVAVTTPSDFDDDDDLDFVAFVVPWYNFDFSYIPYGCLSTGTQLLFQNQGDGQFIMLPLRIPLYDAYVLSMTLLSVTDLDRDGDQDTLFLARNWSPFSEHLGWWDQGPAGIWQVRYIGPARIAHVHDFNGDGLPDIFGLNADGALGWWENQLGK